MSAYLDNRADKRMNPITMLPRFPAARVGASLLELIQSTSDCIVVADSASRIVLVNQRAETMFGYAADHLLEKPLDTLIPPAGSPPPRRQLERLASNRSIGRRSALSLQVMRADGSIAPMRAHLSRIHLEDETYLVLTLRTTSGGDAPPLRSLQGAARRWARTSQLASEVEKRRFSRKLYDDIGQRLSVLKLDLDWLEHRLQADNQHLPARLAQMQGLLDNVITMTKSMASTLRPPVLDDFGLLPAVEWMVESFRKRTGIDCRFECGGFDGKLDEAVESAAFRLVQEGLTNIELHAQAETALLSLEKTGHELRIRLCDDGIGMAEAGYGKPGCYGLMTMQERVLVLGGTIRIENVRPHGVQIVAGIPLEPNDAADAQLIPKNAHDPNRNRR